MKRLLLSLLSSAMLAPLTRAQTDNPSAAERFAAPSGDLVAQENSYWKRTPLPVPDDIVLEGSGILALPGKRLLVTDQDHWTVPEVVAGYRSQNDVESGFRQLKGPHVVEFSPMFHWTEAKIRVHVFYCVLALAVAHLMRRQAHQAGLDLSVRELLTTLAGIQETVLLYPTGNKGRPRAQRILTDTNPTQAALFELFELDKYAPRR